MVNATAPKAGFHQEIPPPHDGQVKQRDKITRWFVLLVVVAITLGLPTRAFAYWGSLFDSLFAERFGTLIGLAIGVGVLAQFAHRLNVYVPEWASYVTQDGFDGTMAVYGPGRHPTFPWEEKNRSGNYSLEIVEQSFPISVQTKTAQVTAKVSFQYALDLAKMDGAIGYDKTTVERGYQAFIKSFLTSHLAKRPAEWALTQVVGLNEKLAEEFKGETVRGDTVADFEKKYKITTAAVLIEGFELPQSVQKARDAIDEAAALQKAVAAFLKITPNKLGQRIKDKEISEEQYRELLNRAMAVSKNAEMKLHVLEANVPAIIGEIFDRWRGQSNKPNAESPKGGA